MRIVCKLSFDGAIKAIDGQETVMYKHGVWNAYEKVSAEQAKEAIRKSGYGADVRVDENGVYYVSCPCDSDMW